MTSIPPSSDPQARFDATAGLRQSPPAFVPQRLSLAIAMALAAPMAHAQVVEVDSSETEVIETRDGGVVVEERAQREAVVSAGDGEATLLGEVKVSASADASAGGLSKVVPGGQVARGSRIGILGSQDTMDTPFSVTSYTNQLIQDQQTQSVGSVLQNDPSVRTARGFGNFQESYFIRGFLLGSDDIAYNGLYGVLPRQYVASELFERVEVLRGASTFLMGATPTGGGAGGSINLLPKRAPNEPLNHVDIGIANNEQFNLSADFARRLGPDGDTGLRLNASHRQGGTGIDHEEVKLDLISAALDWRSSHTRLSADIGYQNHRLNEARTNVTLSSTVTAVPSPAEGTTNWAQPWSYSNEKATFGTLRGEHDFNDAITGWFAFGARQSDEENSLGNLSVTQNNGEGSFYRFDNGRDDRVFSGELGVRGKFTTGSVRHEAVVSLANYQVRTKNGYTFDFGNTLSTSLYNPVRYAEVPFTASALSGNSVDNPGLTGKTRLSSIAIGDTLRFLDERMLLTLGARHQTLKVDSYAYNTGELTSSYDQSRTSPMAALVYKLPHQVSVYANYIESLAQGDTAPATSGDVAVVNAGEQLSPYVSKQKEIGLKYDSGRALFGVALFSTDKPSAFVDAANRFTAGGKDRHQGIELTAQGEAVRGLKVLGGLTLLDAKQRSTGSSETDGKWVIGVPRRQASIALDWSLPWVSGLSADVRLIHTGSSHADAANTLSVPGWSRIDLGARYEMDLQGNLLTLRARIDNLTDRNYWASVGGYPGSGYLVQGAPRTFSLSASLEF